MVNRKNALICALIVLSLVLLGGCSGDDSDKISGTVEPNTQEQEIAQEASKPENTSRDSETTGETGKAAEKETGGSKTEEPEENPLSLGRLEGGVYTNTYLGIVCELDSDWTYYSAEELQELPSATETMLEGSDLGELMAEYTQIMDMQAENVEDLTLINVVYTKLGVQDRILYLTMDDEQVVDSILAQSDMLIESYAQAGMSVQEMKKVAVPFLGEDRFAVWTSAEVQGVMYYILQISDYDVGEYGATITLGSYIEDRTGQLLELFYSLE